MNIDQTDEKAIKENTLYIKNLSKQFNGNFVLHGVDLYIAPGEIHGLLGQNGCGKSTLIKILSGYHAPESGRVWINGKEIPLPVPPGKFNNYGINFVHQDLGLIPDLTAMENLVIGQIAISKKRYVNWNKMNQYAASVFEKYNLNIKPTAIVASLSSVQKAMLAIVRAIEDLQPHITVIDGKKRGLLVLDEPTVFLPKVEVNLLFDMVRQISAEGISVLFVSHDLDEVMELTDSFTVLRDGYLIDRRDTKSVQKSDIIELIMGKKLSAYQLAKEKDQDLGTREITFSAKGISGLTVDDISFDVYKGEILGITGLVGSGFEEIPYLLFGSQEIKFGSVAVKGEIFDLKDFNPIKAVEKGMAMIPSDRANAGSIGELEISENLIMQTLDKYNPRFLNEKAIQKDSQELIDYYQIIPPEPNMLLSNLSGGNQQKVLIAKWMSNKPGILILHEPTQGIDVGARQQIFQYIDLASQSGASVICLSSDYEQLEQICTRVIVLSKGKIAGELKGNEVRKDQIISLCYKTAEETNILQK